MKYKFILDNRHRWSVLSMSRVFNVSSQSYYSWLKRPLSKRAQSNQQLDTKIKETFEQHKKRSGAPRITEDLNALGESVSQNRVAKRMKALQLKAIQAKKFKVTTDSRHNKPVAPNLLKQDFMANQPNKKWVGDIT